MDDFDILLARALARDEWVECRRCHKRAVVFCGGCDGTPPKEPDTEPVFPMAYCSHSCSRKDWNQGGPKAHKLFCPRFHQRRYLYRAAATAQQVFIFLQMAKLDQKISQSFVKDGFFGYTWTPSEPGSFADFPYDIVSGVRDTLRVLSYKKADEALVYMCNFASKLLLGRCTKCVEMKFRVKSPKGRPMFANDPVDFMDVNHEVDRRTFKALKITLPAMDSFAEETFIWNLAGPEHEIYDPIADWDFFRANNELMEEPTEFEYGNQRRLWEHFDLSDSADSMLKMLTTLTRTSKGEKHREYHKRLVDGQRKLRHFCQAVDESILKAEAESGSTVAMALALAEHEYVAWKPKFLDAFRLDIMKAREPKPKEKAST